ncbi:MAG TPA: hypothetical protein VIM74_05830 [Casimicrobiaceae bacterium]
MTEPSAEAMAMVDLLPAEASPKVIARALDEFARLAVAAERERCAAIVRRISP